MTATAALNMLLGAMLVAIGVLAAALADRIRGLRITRERATAAPPREMPSRAAVAPAPVRAARATIEVIEAEPKVKAKGMADDVIAALIAAGYKKSIAAEAAWGCSQTERATIENWTRAALRAAAKGGMS